jgi:spermidine synthase
MTLWSEDTMNPWKLIDTAPVPTGGGVMELLARGDEMLIRVDGQALMSTRMHGSEEALADLAYDRIGGRTSKTLIGGLGMGFTAAAALRRCSAADTVCIAELVPSIVEWNRGPLGEASGRPLDDPRVTIHLGDVVDLVRKSTETWDLILLDVDNGPAGLSTAENSWLYSKPGLKSLRRALRPGGFLGIWSATRDDAFKQRMARSGFSVEEIFARARGGRRGGRHVIWLGARR